MDRSAFTERILRNWARRYSCSLEALHQPGTELIAEESFSGSRAIHTWHIARHAFVRFDPALQLTVETLLAVLDNPVGIEPGQLTGALPAAGVPVNRAERGLLSYLYPPDFKPASTPAGFTIRQLEPGDAQAVADLKAACHPDEIEEAEVSVEDEIPFGCFNGDRLAAVATGFRLTGFMDIGVVTHPDFRRQALGRTVVSTLCAWCLGRDILLQYRNAEANVASHKLALGLGFSPMVYSEHIYLEPVTTV